MAELLAEVVGAVALAALVAYAVLAGADFGGGVWDLTARGPRAAEQRAAIAAAMGPVWEANHVWLIFLIVLLFTCFPAAFAVLSVAFFVPFHLVLLGVVLRGAAFVFRAHGHAAASTEPNAASTGPEAASTGLTWDHVFGGASTITPFLLGACLGAVSNGHVRTEGTGGGASLTPGSEWAWLDPLALAIGALSLALCAYLAAVYLTLETEGEVREDFRRRALGVWLVAGVLSIGTLLLTYTEAPRLWMALTSARAAPAVAIGVLLAPASALAMYRRHYQWARLLGAAQVVLLLVGWALAQWPYVVYPDVTLTGSAAPGPTLTFVLWTLIPGLGLLLPSLWLLFAVFKGRNPAVA